MDDNFVERGDSLMERGRQVYFDQFPPVHARSSSLSPGTIVAAREVKFALRLAGGGRGKMSTLPVFRFATPCLSQAK